MWCFRACVRALSSVWPPRPTVLQQRQAFRRTYATFVRSLIKRMSSTGAARGADVTLAVDEMSGARGTAERVTIIDADRATLVNEALANAASTPEAAAPVVAPSAREADDARDSTSPGLSFVEPAHDRCASIAGGDLGNSSSSVDLQPPPAARLVEENSCTAATSAETDIQVPDVSKRSKRNMKRRQLHADQATGSATEAKRRSARCDADTDDQPAEKRWRDDADAGFGREVFSETEYYLENGLRKVYPYYYTYLTHCKGRWVGRNVIDVFTAEYRNCTPEQHVKAITSGRLKINGHMVSPDYIFKGCNELVSNLVHRHEVPISAAPIQIVSLTADLVVINKPSSIPVHPCGRYRHNSVAFILGKEHGLQNLRTLYRLDRLTSGVLIMARTHATAERMMRHINDRKVTKAYVCRVDGEFPSFAECKEPMDRVHHALGAWRVKPGGKPSYTSFERMSFNGKTSVVKCFPHTGRTHQIRVHLQYMGYPITNDPLYNHPVWGTSRGKGCDYGKSDDQLYHDLLSVHTVENYTELEVAPSAAVAAIDDGGSDSSTPPRDPASTFDSSKLFLDADCEHCRICYKDPRPEELIMYLHALSYKGPDWEFSTDLPDWAKDDWQC